MPENNFRIPQVGEGVTYNVGSDSYPGTIIEVSKSGKSFVFQDDNVVRKSGSFQSGDWEGDFIPNNSGEKRTARWSVRKGQGFFRHDGGVVTVGVRRYFNDPNF